MWSQALRHDIAPFRRAVCLGSSIDVLVRCRNEATRESDMRLLRDIEGPGLIDRISGRTFYRDELNDIWQLLQPVADELNASGKVDERASSR